jgi:hypothetical protein
MIWRSVVKGVAVAIIQVPIRTDLNVDLALGLYNFVFFA